MSMELLTASFFAMLLGLILGFLIKKDGFTKQTDQSIKNFSTMKSVIKKNSKKNKPKICDDDAMVVKEQEL